MRSALRLVLLIAACLASAPALGQGGVLDPGPAQPAARAQSWDYQSAASPQTPLQMVQQKAQIRASERMSRIATAEWYGFSKARPRTSSTPFTGLYGDQYQSVSLGRPAAWHASRAVIIVR